MSQNPSLRDACCLLEGVDLQSQRVRRLLERRFTSNVGKTSFDFKSFLPEQPSNNAKVTRSFLRFQPPTNHSEESEAYSSSASNASSDDDEEAEDADATSPSISDEHYRELAEWEPNQCRLTIETDDEEVEDEDEATIEPSKAPENAPEEMDVTPELIASQPVPDTQEEDVSVTFVKPSIKSEPMHHDGQASADLPQLDGHVDFPSAPPPSRLAQNSQERKLNDVIARIIEKQPPQKRTIQLHRIPPVFSKQRSSEQPKKKPADQAPRKRRASSTKTDRPKEQAKRTEKPPKKPPSRILSTLMKNNGDAIRESDVRHVASYTHTWGASRPSHAKPGKQSRPHFDPVDENQTIHRQISDSTHLSRTWLSKEKSAFQHMKLAQRKMSSFNDKQLSKPKENATKPLKPSKPKDLPIQRPPSKDSDIKPKKKSKEVKRLISKHPKPISNHSSRTVDLLRPRNNIVDGSNANEQLSTVTPPPKPSSTATTSTSKRPATFFDGCIVIDDSDDEMEQSNQIVTIDDDEIQEIDRQQYSIVFDIRARQKELDHIVHTPAMHLKWLLNLEHLLLDHILICHENNRCPCHKEHRNSISTACTNPPSTIAYQVEPSFVSIIIINFIKIFLLRNSPDDQQEFALVQFGITSHLRYLLLELPTYVHNEGKDLDENCPKCHQYSLIINILFDLLFDLIEYDLCGLNTQMKYRSSLIEDDYFTRFLQSKVTKKNPFYRIKLVIYFIELIGIHMNKCRDKKQFQFNQSEHKLFHSIEDFLRHILSHINNLVNERVSICFNVMELCLLFVNEKATRVQQMTTFLVELCKHNTAHASLLLLDENLLVDIRLLVINELIGERFKLRLATIPDINTFFEQILTMLNSKEPTDETALLLLRSLLNAYADLIIEMKTMPALHSDNMQLLTTLLRSQFEIVFHRLVHISFDDQSQFAQMQRTLFFFRLLQYLTTGGMATDSEPLQSSRTTDEHGEDGIRTEVAQLLNDLLTQIEGEVSPSHSSTFTSFVVEDIVTKIRSTALAHKPSSSTDEISSHSLSSSIVDVPSAHSSRSISPSQTLNDLNQVLQPIDKRILEDIEAYSRELAQEFVTCVEQLTLSLHHMSATSVCCLQTYRDAVGEKLNETLETNIKTIYSFMAQAEQLSAQLAPIYELQKKITYIKQLLDILSQSI